MQEDFKKVSPDNSGSFDPVSLLEEIRGYAEEMTRHAVQIAPRTVGREHNQNFVKYKKLLSILSEK